MNLKDRPFSSCYLGTWKLREPTKLTQRQTVDHLRPEEVKSKIPTISLVHHPLMCIVGE